MYGIARDRMTSFYDSLFWTIAIAGLAAMCAVVWLWP